MPAIKRELLYGWGHYPVEECISYRPERRRDLDLIMQEHHGPLLARGMGRSYGDASLQPGGTVRTERLNHFIEFDTTQGIVHVQGGVTLAELMEVAIPRGWLPPVIPGTRHVTLGGAFACNVHGKNHYREGDFAEHVQSVRLMLADGEVIDCSPQQHAEIFWATAGGMGMTGLILEMTLKLKPITSSSLRTTTYRVDSMTDMIAAFEHYRVSDEYMVGWIDHTAKGDALGRGIFEAASHIPYGENSAPLSEYDPPRSRLSVPCFMPSFLLNRHSMAVYNRLRFRKYSAWREIETVGFNGFFHPLDSIGNWNRLYGRRGFFQYQCALPDTADVAARLTALLSAIQRHKLFSFLAVLKYHRQGKGYLTFPLQGYSLALDFPNTRRVRSMLPQLDQWVADHGGRVYLAKDALLTPELFYQMYGQTAHDWCEIIHDVDPKGRFSSLMSQRLKWKQFA